MVTTKMKVAGMGEDEEEGEEAAEAMAMMAGAMTSTIEVTDISTVTLDPALFEIPAGYKQASSMQELYGSSPISSVRRDAGGAPGRRVSFPGRPARKHTAARVPSGLNAASSAACARAARRLRLSSCVGRTDIKTVRRFAARASTADDNPDCRRRKRCLRFWVG